MEWYVALLFLLSMILGFMFIGVPVALAFLAANMVGATYFMGGSGDLLTQMSRGIGQSTNNALPTVTTFNLMPVPMFLLMGEIYVSALPFMACAILLVGLLIVWPQIALWLPSFGG